MPELRADSLGDISVGPNGFLRLLETQLGIPARDISFTARLIQYLGCIDRVNHAAAFYHESYQADPFSVARTLLQWRDQWYLAGWTGRFAGDAPAGCGTWQPLKPSRRHCGAGPGPAHPARDPAAA
ncbi:MAG: hypothetical protein IPG06_22270 [Haliea sp.]|nr:hypothetical protein [Haliea sp.]